MIKEVLIKIGVDLSHLEVTSPNLRPLSNDPQAREALKTYRNIMSRDEDVMLNMANKAIEAERVGDIDEMILNAENLAEMYEGYLLGLKNSIILLNQIEQNVQSNDKQVTETNRYPLYYNPRPDDMG